VVCKAAFRAPKKALYCSVACRNKAAYWRNPEAYRESRRKSYRKQPRKG
jgi:hypothetical protein